MSDSFNKVVRDFTKSLQAMAPNKTSPYDTQAEVRRIEGDTAWVHIPGGVDETPVQLTTNAKKGDIVQVRVSGGRAWLYGNQTSPPTDDTTAKEAQKTAAVADEHAVSAITSAMLAQEFAEQAKSDAESASVAAGQAWTKAGEAETAAGQAWTKAGEAETAAWSASESANEAQQSATSASVSATTALTQLSIVEDVVGVLDLISQNGEYEKTLDTEAQPNKWYFTRAGSGTTADPYVYEVVASPQFEYVITSDVAIVQGKPYYTRTGSGTEADPYSYILVENPVVADIGTYYGNTGWNYYQLVGIDQAIQNYVSSHIALSGNSLYLQNGATRVELSTTDGMILYNESGNPVAQYGADTIIGNINQFGIKIGESPESTQQTPIYELGFYQDGNRVAYINNNSLYITQTVVLRQMQMGDSLGIWAWCIHEVNAKNNLYLKWLG